MGTQTAQNSATLRIGGASGISELANYRTPSPMTRAPQIFVRWLPQLATAAPGPSCCMVRSDSCCGFLPLLTWKLLASALKFVAAVQTICCHVLPRLTDAAPSIYMRMHVSSWGRINPPAGCQSDKRIWPVCHTQSFSFLSSDLLEDP